MEFNIGPLGQFEGHIAGLDKMAGVAADASALGAFYLSKRRKAAKAHNDEPESNTVGSSGGRPVREGWGSPVNSPVS